MPTLVAFISLPLVKLDIWATSVSDQLGKRPNFAKNFLMTLYICTRDAGYNVHSMKGHFKNSSMASTYLQTSNISRTLVGNKIVNHSDVVGASPVGAAPTTSQFST